MNVLRAILRPASAALLSRNARRSQQQLLPGLQRFAHSHGVNSDTQRPVLQPAISHPRRFSPKLFSTEALETLENEDSPAESSTFEIFRARALQKGRVMQRPLEKLLSQIDPREDKDQLPFLLNCCSDLMPNLVGEEKLELASKIWQTFVEGSHEFGVLDVIAFLNVHASSRVDFNPGGWWVSEKVQKLLEQPECLTQLLKCAAECGNLAAIADILVKMKKQEMVIGEKELALCIIGEGRAKNFKGVESILETMRLAKLEQGQLTYHALLQAAIDNQQPISELLRDMQEKKIGLTEKQSVQLVRCLANANDSKQLSSILRLFPVDGLGHDIRNLIVELIYEGKHFYACNIYPKLLKDVNSEELNSILAFFPVELVRSGKNAEEILEICLSLQSFFPNHNSFLHYATETSLRDSHKKPLSLELLGHITPLRPHYFWPVLLRSDSLEDVVATVQRMLSLGVQLDQETLTFYIHPRMLSWDSPINVITHLQKECELTVNKQLGPMLTALLLAKQIDEALHLCKLIKSRALDAKRLIKPLSNAVRETGKIASAAHLLALIVDSRLYHECDVVGLFLADYCRRCMPGDLKEVLNHLAKFQLRISMACYEILMMKPVVRQIGVQHLDLLTDSAYGGANTFSSLPHPRDMNLDELEAHLIELKIKKMNTRGVLRKLLQLHCRNRNVERALQIKKEMDAERCEFSPGILSALLSLYVHLQDESRATEVYRQIEEFPKFFLDEHKLIDYCKLKVQTGSSLDEVCQLLQNYINNLTQNRRSPRNLDSRNCIELVKEVRKSLGDESAQTMSNKLSDFGFL